MKKISYLLFIALAIGCSPKKAKIKGILYDYKNETVVLERISGNKLIFVDSIKVDGSGNFRTSYKFDNDKQPAILNIRSGSDYITLLVEPGENIEVTSLVNLSKNYTIAGSKGSEELRAINSDLVRTSYSIDSLYRLYNRTDNWILKDNLLIEIENQYNDFKIRSIHYIVDNPSSLVSMVALYQTMPNGISIYTDKNDILYFRMVKDSLMARYPKSEYVKAMSRDVKAQENRQSLDEMVRNSILNRSDNIGLPEIELNDIHGITHKFSNLKGKVILLVFWDSTLPNWVVLNAELRDLFEEYQESGLMIYQVSLNEDKLTWINAVFQRGIRWISVRDPQAELSIVARNYNVTTLPANFLIDRDGNIVGKNIWGYDLVKSVNQLTN